MEHVLHFQECCNRTAVVFLFVSVAEILNSRFLHFIQVPLVSFIRTCFNLNFISGVQFFAVSVCLLVVCHSCYNFKMHVCHFISWFFLVD